MVRIRLAAVTVLATCSQTYDVRGRSIEGKLELHEDINFQRRDWVFERAGWFCMLFVVVAAGAGLLGHGPLSDTHAAAADRSLVVEYARFERHGAPSSLTVHVHRQRTSDSTVRVWLSNEYLRGIRLNKIVPQPETEISAADRTFFEVSVAPGTDTARVTFHFTPETIGSRQLRVGGGPRELTLSQFVYP